MLCFLPIPIIGARSAQSGIKIARTGDRSRLIEHRWQRQTRRFAPAQGDGRQALTEALLRDDVDLAA
jgi:hypothetical protein